MKKKRLGFLFIIGFLILISPTVLHGQEKPIFEEYHSQLEMEYFIPFVTYDGSFHVATYSKMSSILRDQELQYMLYASGEDFNMVFGYTYHTPYWSYGLNFYHMPVYTGPIWATGFFELQSGASLLASRHIGNENRIDLRLQFEKFSPLSSSPFPVESGSLLGFEATVNQDNFSFFSQKGHRRYLSIGGALPLLGTDYQYLKLEIDNRNYLPINPRTSFILSGCGGKIWGMYPIHRGFSLGSIQQVSMSSFGTLSNIGLLGALADTVLRGYPEYYFQGDSFILGNLELRSLLWPSEYRKLRSVGLTLVFFTDASLVWKDGSRVTASPSIGAGMGLKFFLGGLNIGLDYAIPINTPGALPRWHFSIGEVF